MGPSIRHVVRPGKPRRLLAGALVSLVGYVALAVFAARPQLAAFDQGTRAWIGLLRDGAPHLPMDLVTGLGDRVGLIAMIAVAVPVLWRVNRRWALALPVLMAGVGALHWLAKAASARARPDLAPWGFRAATSSASSFSSAW